MMSHPETILVVDDNPASRYSTSRVLRSAKFHVLEAATGGDGIQLAKRADLVVLDVNLPDISGFEVCRALRSDPTTMRVPVIHLSASFVSDKDKVFGLDSGADGYLIHPAEPPVLIATVKAFLRARRAEEAMRQSDESFKAIFNLAPNGICLLDEKNCYLQVNPTMCQMLNRTDREILGKPFTTFVPPECQTQVNAASEHLSRTGAWQGTLPVARANGERIEAEWNISAHSIAGMKVAVLTDVTERKNIAARREEALAAEKTARIEAERVSQLKDDFLATLSHELRTPLSAILGWSELLKGHQVTADKVQTGMDSIRRNARAQMGMIEDLLDMSRIISGKLHLDVREIDLRAVVVAAAESVKLAAQAKAVQLDVTSIDSVMIIGDASRLQQVVWNLLNNAIKFTPRGGRVEVSVRPAPQEVQITVKDTGEGIDPNFLPHVFDRFRQADSSMTRAKGGLGLGLSIVKQVIEHHGGKVAAVSAGKDQGSTFTVTIPRILQVEAAPSDLGRHVTPAPVADFEYPHDALREKRVLFVDDDEDGRTIVSHILETYGATVRVAASANEAIDILQSWKPDLLLSDIAMPAKDGYELLRQVHSDARYHDLPGIALTAFAREEDKVRAMEAGFLAHISKPVEPGRLIQTITDLPHQQ